MGRILAAIGIRRLAGVGLCGVGLLTLLVLVVLLFGHIGRPPAMFKLPQIAIHDGFPKWAGVLDRDWARDASLGTLCDERLGRRCGLSSWRRFLDEVRDAPFTDRIAAVNAYVNRVGYREDAAAWGASDYWAAPGEFFARGGDCEDYAIAKYWSLRAIGVPAERMNIVVLQDQKRGVPHAVLNVRWAGPDLVLDNLSDEVRVWPQLSHYQQVYRINESSYEIVRSQTLPSLLQSAGS